MPRLNKRLVIPAIALGAIVLGGVLFVKAQRHLAVPEEPASVVFSAHPWQAIETAETVYDGKLGAGWQDWGWGPHQIPTSGPAKIVFAGYGGLILRHELLRENFGVLAFRFRAPAEWTDFLQVTLKTSQSADATLGQVSVDPEHIEEREDGWREVRIELRELNPSRAPFDRIVIGARSMVGPDWVSIDKIVLSKPGSGTHALASAPRRSSTLKVLCGAATHAINPGIYGSSNGVWDSGLSAYRLGGNPTSRYNWDIGAWNSANDWFFMNGTSIDMPALLDDASKRGIPVTLTVPMLGWVAKDTNSVGFPAAKFEKQRKYEPNRPGIGDGYRPDGKPIAPGPPSQTSIPAPPELIGKWIRAAREKDLTRPKRISKSFILDNEPQLWNTTHRDLHPEPLGYDELLDRTLRYASEVRRADPDAIIAGPAEWGWLGYLYSARDLEAGKFIRPDRRAHGDEPLIPWYLRKIAQFEKSNGIKLLDVLDVHFYPAAEKMHGSDERVDPEGRALRLRSTRALWDPSYRDESWVDEPIRLIPRLREWVRDNHPGLAISIGEWSFGADADISGALATAEALGRFGQLALDSAFYWDGPKANTGTYWAFRAFRNFDGNGGRFQDESLDTRGEDKVSVFASRDPSRSQVVLILINRDPEFEVQTQVRLDSCGAPSSFRSFEYREGSTSLTELPVESVNGDQLAVSLPPYSIKVLDVRYGSRDGG